MHSCDSTTTIEQSPLRTATHGIPVTAQVRHLRIDSPSSSISPMFKSLQSKQPTAVTLDNMLIGRRTGQCSIHDAATEVQAVLPLPCGTQVRSRGAVRHLTEADKAQNRYIDTIFAVLGTSDDASLQTTGPPWVLCIDDDVDFANSLKLRLQQYGIEVFQAFSGMAGYRTAFVSPAKAIILDQWMPDGNGEYVLRRLKENPVTRDIPVIVLTGSRDRMLERNMYNLGAAKFFNKPVPWEELWAELKQHTG
ncbi:MAG: response regulator [Planctomycetota bacterium]|nr:response regulator [Planctomycetota bacterium]